MTHTEKLTWVNGQLQSTISVFDRGLTFGDGLFETMALRRGSIALLDYHLDRFLFGAKRLGLNVNRQQFLSDLEWAQTHSQQHPDANWRLKYIVTRGESDSGYTPSPHSTPTRIMHLLPYDAGFARLMQQQGVKTSTCHWRLSEQANLAGIKHLNRLDQVKGRQELSDTDCYEGLMRDQHGNYIEGTMSNVFAVAPDGELITPNLASSGVAGVMRRVVMEKLAPAINKACYEAEIHRMTEFTEVFITNAMIGIVPVLAADTTQYPIGPVTRQLQQQLQLLLRQQP